MFFLILIFSYLLGSLPFGYLIGKSKGVDITSTGSGNIGATNVHRVLGKSAGLLVFVLDTIKGFLPTFLVLKLGFSKEAALFCGVIAIIGHIFSPFLNFRGGKGISTGLGVLFASNFILALVCLGFFVLVVLVTRYISLGSIAAVLSLFIFGFIFDHSWRISAFYLALGLLILLRHKSNIRRLLNGTESRFSFGSHQTKSM